MVGPHTIAETERTASERLQGLEIDFLSYEVISNLYRAANNVRNHFERNVLAEVDLTWTGFVVLWVSWIWGSAETRMIANEVGVSKATLSGVLNTLENRGFLKRKRSPEDGRLVLVTLTPAGTRLVKSVYPKINGAEAYATRLLNQKSKKEAAAHFRAIAKATNTAEAI